MFYKKYDNKIMKINKVLIVIGLLLVGVGCSIDEVVDPNQPSLAGISDNPNQQTLNLLIGGLEARARDQRGAYVTGTGSIARELYFFNSSDPTTTANLIGKNGVSLSGSEPQLTSSYFAHYQAIKSAEIILETVEISPVSEALKQGYRGVANTIKGLMLLNVLSMLNDNGIRIEINDPENLGPFLSKDAGFQAIRQLLDDGFNQLQNAEFAFQLSSGFAGFDTPESFALFNRAIAARAAIYEEDYVAALNLVNASFLDLDGDLMTGVKRIYGIGGTEILNPVFKAPQQSGDQIIAHDRFVNDILPGDTRINKFRLRNDPVSRDNLNGTHEISLYANSTTPIDHIRNEELILIYAEANIQGNNFPDAVTALNVIRNEYGLGDYAGPMTFDALIDEMLYQRSYSFWAEGHQMFDLRRYDRLNDTFLPIDRPGDIVHTEFPIPLFENP